MPKTKKRTMQQMEMDLYKGAIIVGSIILVDLLKKFLDNRRPSARKGEYVDYEEVK